MKPIGKAQGKGIFLFSKLSAIKKWKERNNEVESYIVQKYIRNPFLIGNKKFDLRLYLLITSIKPLKIWIHRSGFARFSSVKYNSNHENISDNLVHLTNYSIHKKCSKQTNKWNVHSLRLFLATQHGEETTSLLFGKIQNILLKTILSVEDKLINDSNCFELFGFDVLIDANLKPWLMEVNSFPSLTSTDEEDKALKTQVIEDLFDVIDLENQLTGKEVKVGGFDLVFNETEVNIEDRDETVFDFEDKLSYVQSRIGSTFEKDEIIEVEM